MSASVDYVGGAAIVAKHLIARPAPKVTFSTVLGDDALGDFVLDDLSDAGIDVRAVIDRSRPTVNKNAIVVGGYRLLKVDTLDNRSISDNILDDDRRRRCATRRPTRSSIRISATVSSTAVRSRELIKAIPPDAYRVADSQVASRWGNITEFHGFRSDHAERA